MKDKKDIAARVAAKFDIIKKLIFAEESEFSEAVLADGTSVKVTPGLEVGASVTVMVDGAEQPAPEGEHTLADGSVIVTDAAGIITEVRPYVEDKQTDEQKMNEQIKNEFAEMSKGLLSKFNEAIEASNKVIEELQKQQKETQDAFAKQTAESTTFKKEVVELVKEIAESPAFSEEGSKHVFTKVAKDKTPKDRVSMLVDNYLSARNN